MCPGEVYLLEIPILPTGNLFRAGSRIKLRISGFDDPPGHPLEMIATDHPSALILPITRGNVEGTFITGGKPFI